jgi:hypothetical protein
MKTFAAIIVVTASLTYAQTPSDATTQALLAEVRQLRLAMERIASVTPKAQLTLQRLQLQQDHVSRVSRQLEELRDQIAKAAAEDGHMVGQLKAMEGHLAEEQDATKRKSMEDELKMMKTRFEQHSEQRRSQDAQQRAREGELASRLYTEQGKMNELNDRLNALERQLELPPSKP